MGPGGDGIDGGRNDRDAGGSPLLLTVGHGTLGEDDLARLLQAAGIRQLVDVRTAPGSRRHPHVARAALEQWVPAAGIAYRWEPDLGGFRRPLPTSANTALRHPSFRGYADYMATELFAGALARLLDDAARQLTAAMCSETLWWRCHRRLIADAAVLVAGAAVRHLGHDGRLSPHRVTEGARLVTVDGAAGLRYDAEPPVGTTAAR